MNAPTLELAQNDNIDTLIALLARVSERLREAAGMLARLAASDPDIVEKIRNLQPEIPRAFLVNLLRVGEGSLHPQLFMASGAAYNRLRALPRTVQDQVLREGAIDVAMGDDAMRVPLAELKPEQISQAFGPSGLRSVDEQRAFVKRRTMSDSRPVSRSEAFPWIVKKDRVTILRSVELTRKDVMHILEELST